MSIQKQVAMVASGVVLLFGLMKAEMGLAQTTPSNPKVKTAMQWDKSLIPETFREDSDVMIEMYDRPDLGKDIHQLVYEASSKAGTVSYTELRRNSNGNDKIDREDEVVQSSLRAQNLKSNDGSKVNKVIDTGSLIDYSKTAKIQTFNATTKEMIKVNGFADRNSAFIEIDDTLGTTHSLDKKAKFRGWGGSGNN